MSTSRMPKTPGVSSVKSSIKLFNDTVVWVRRRLLLTDVRIMMQFHTKKKKKKSG